MPTHMPTNVTRLVGMSVFLFMTLVFLIGATARIRRMGRHMNREPEPIQDLLDAQLRQPSLCFVNFGATNFLILV